MEERKKKKGLDCEAIFDSGELKHRGLMFTLTQTVDTNALFGFKAVAIIFWDSLFKVSAPHCTVSARIDEGACLLLEEEFSRPDLSVISVTTQQSHLALTCM